MELSKYFYIKDVVNCDGSFLTEYQIKTKVTRNAKLDSRVFSS